MDNKTDGNPNTTFENGDKLPQENFLHIILWHRWTILLTVAGFLIITLIFLMKTTPIYTSASRLYVEQSGPKIINEYEGIMTRANNYLYTQGELIKSTPIVNEVSNIEYIKYFKTFDEIDNIAGYIKKNLTVDIGRKDDIITVSFESPYPEEAAQIVNAIVESYISYHSTRKRSTVSEVLRILQKEKVKRDKELSDKFKELLAFTKKQGIVSFDNNGGNIVFDRLNKLSSALTETQLLALNAKADFEAVQNMANDPEKIRQFAGASTGSGILVFGSDRENQLRAELRNAKTELEDTRYHCTEDHPSIQAIHSKIDRIKQELNEQGRQFADAYIEVMQLRWMATKQREDELAASFEKQYQEAQKLGLKAAEYAVLQSELKRAERVCEILDNRIKELNVTEDTGALNISILEAARPAENPSKPQKARTMTMALIMGLICGTGLAFLREWMDYRLHSSEEITALLGVPVLGEVPAISEGQKIIMTRGQEIWLKLKALYERIELKAQPVKAKKFSTLHKPKTNKLRKQTLMSQARIYRAMHASDSNKYQHAATRTPETKSVKTSSGSETQNITERGQIVRLKPKSIVAEAYRTIRTSIFFGVPKDGAKTILITSPAPGDGKTTLASNLAIAMAQAGQRTLLIDADLRKPKQHTIFNIDSEPGLSSILSEAIRLDEAIQPGSVTGLDLLTCGPQISNPSEILNSEAFALILENLTKCYNRIIIDSPPVVPVADSQIIAARCDIVLLVVRAGKTTRRLVQRARDNLVSVGGRLLGAIVNDVAQKRSRYGYYGRYHSSYGYGGYGYGGYGYGSYYGEDNGTESKQEYEQKISV